MAESGSPADVVGTWTPPASIDEARARARERFKSRLETGQQIGECGCGDDAPVTGKNDDSPAECVVGVRFRDSGRVYYFRPAQVELAVGDWAVVATGRGEEAARVVIAPHQVRRGTLQGDLRQVLRRLDEDDTRRLTGQKQRGAEAIKVFGERSRTRRLGVKPIAADFNFDGTAVTVSYSVPDRDRGPDAGSLRDFAKDLGAELACRIEFRQVGPRDEARLLGGLGRCGRTLCCSSWLPVYPDISVSMAKNQDLPLNPSKVSGVCGRLLCCLSYENEQYRQMKAVMPKLGQPIDTPGGPGQVVSMHLLKELVTVRLDQDNTDVTFRSDELGLGAARAAPAPAPTHAPDPVAAVAEPAVDEVLSAPSEEIPAAPVRRRRRRRSGRRGGGSA